METLDKEHLHNLYMTYYGNVQHQKEREVCIRCGKARVLGQRGQAKGKCKLCRVKERMADHEAIHQA